MLYVLFCLAEQNDSALFLLSLSVTGRRIQCVSTRSRTVRHICIYQSSLEHQVFRKLRCYNI